MEVKNLTVEQVAQLKLRVEDLSRQQRLLIALQLEMQTYVAQVIGVDVTSQSWELDLEKGVMTRATNQ